MIWQVLFPKPQGLKPSEMLLLIAERWRWPNVAPNDVGPIAWRMWKRGDLIKDGPRYRIDPEVIKEAMKDEAPGSEEPSAPRHHGDGNGSLSSSGSKEAHSSPAALPGAIPADPGAVSPREKGG